MQNKNKEQYKRLESLGLEIYVVRNAKKKIEKKDKELTAETKRLMLEELQTREYEGKRVDIHCKPQSHEKKVDPQIAIRRVPLEILAGMISIGREEFEEYIKKNEIALSEEEYLTSPGEYEVVRVKPKPPFYSIRTQARKLYALLKGLVSIK